MVVVVFAVVLSTAEPLTPLVVPLVPPEVSVSLVVAVAVVALAAGVLGAKVNAATEVVAAAVVTLAAEVLGMPMVLVALGACGTEVAVATVEAGSGVAVSVGKAVLTTTALVEAAATEVVTARAVAAAACVVTVSSLHVHSCLSPPVHVQVTLEAAK